MDLVVAMAVWRSQLPFFLHGFPFAKLDQDTVEGALLSIPSLTDPRGIQVGLEQCGGDTWRSERVG